MRFAGILLWLTHLTTLIGAVEVLMNDTSLIYTIPSITTFNFTWSDFNNVVAQNGGKAWIPDFCYGVNYTYVSAMNLLFNGTSVQIEFTSTEISIWYWMLNQRSLGYIYLDDQPYTTTLNNYDPSYSSTACRDTSIRISGLQNTTHTLKIVTDLENGIPLSPLLEKFVYPGGTENPAPTQSQASGPKINIPIIAGAAGGAALVLLVLGIGIWFCLRRRSERSRNRSNYMSPQMAQLDPVQFAPVTPFVQPQEDGVVYTHPNNSRISTQASITQMNTGQPATHEAALWDARSTSSYTATSQAPGSSVSYPSEKGRYRSPPLPSSRFSLSSEPDNSSPGKPLQALSSETSLGASRTSSTRKVLHKRPQASVDGSSSRSFQEKAVPKPLSTPPTFVPQHGRSDTIESVWGSSNTRVSAQQEPAIQITEPFNPYAPITQPQAASSSNLGVINEGASLSRRNTEAPPRYDSLDFSRS